MKCELLLFINSISLIQKAMGVDCEGPSWINWGFSFIPIVLHDADIYILSPLQNARSWKSTLSATRKKGNTLLVS